MSNRELADEIEQYLAPDATYHHWQPSMEDMEQIIAVLRGEPEPIHRECEQCGMLVACWSDAQIEAIERSAAALHAKIKPLVR